MAKFIVNVYNESDKGIVGAEVYITDEDGRVQSVEIVDAKELKELQNKLNQIGDEYVTWDGYWQYLEHNTTSHVIDAQTLDGLSAKELLGQVSIPEGHSVIDDLNSDSRTDGLSAKMGKELAQRIKKLETGSSGSASSGSTGSNGGWASNKDLELLTERVHDLENNKNIIFDQIQTLAKMSTRFDIFRDKGNDGSWGGFGYTSLDLQIGQTNRLRVLYPYSSYWKSDTIPITGTPNIIGSKVTWFIGDKIYEDDQFNDPEVSNGITVTNPKGNYLAVAVVKGPDKRQWGSDFPLGFAVKPITIH